MGDSEKKKKKGFSSEDRCYRCGLRGHYGYDCDKFHGRSLKSEKEKPKRNFDKVRVHTLGRTRVGGWLMSGITELE